MALRPFLLLLLLQWSSLSAVARADTPDISDEIVNFAPPCAQRCFRSWIEANLDIDDCDDSPSLRCLCRQRGKGGYTIGEGAVSCIVGERNRGTCQSSEADSEFDTRNVWRKVVANAKKGKTTSTAYNMCVGVLDAAVNTHETIVATMVVPSGTGPLVVPSTTRTTTSSRMRTSSATRTASTASTTGSTSTTKGSIITSTTGTSSTTRASTTTTETAAPTVESDRATLEPSAENKNEPQQLTSAQIAGISLGCIAVVVLGVVLILLARCVRRKRFGDAESGFARIRDSLSFGRKSLPNSPQAFQISHPLHKDPVEMQFQRPGRHVNIQPEGVGLAITNATGLIAPGRAPGVGTARIVPRTPPKMMITPPSRPHTPKAQAQNSPPKPTLTLAIPKEPGVVRKEPSKIMTAPPARERDSVVTEFAEDGEGDSRHATSIWRPPPTDPQSATAYYFADKGGNWILRNSNSDGRSGAPQELATPPLELPSPQDQTKAEKAFVPYTPGAAPAPLRIPSRERQKLGSPIAFKDQQRPVTGASSVYSTDVPMTMAPGPENPLPTQALPVPDSYFAMVRDGRDLTRGKNRRKSTRRASRRRSEDSTTSIESAAAGPFEDEDIIDDEPQVDLSPVAESPASPGKSPVQYPRIPRNGEQRQQQQQYLAPTGAGRAPQNLRVFPPPPRTDSLRQQRGQNTVSGNNSFGGINMSIRAVGQSRSTRTGPTSGAQTYLNPNPNRNPGQLRTGSPEERLASPTERQPQEQQLQQQLQWQEPQQAQGSGYNAYRGQQQQQQHSSKQQQAWRLERRQPGSAMPAYYELPAEPVVKRERQEYRAMPPPQQQQQQQQQRLPQLQSVEHTPLYHSRTGGSQSQQPHLQMTGTDGGVQGSSLLAKRLGADRAAALAFGSDSGAESPLRRVPKGWTREEQQQQQQQPRQQRAQYLDGNGGNGRTQAGGDPGRILIGQQQQQQQVSGPAPPLTPGWMPELTPSRRGDDLFLNVQ